MKNQTKAFIAIAAYFAIAIPGSVALTHHLCKTAKAQPNTQTKPALVYGPNAKKPSVHSKLRPVVRSTPVAAVSNVSSNIRSRCEKEWGTNYRMVKYCIDQQTEAARSLGY